MCQKQSGMANKLAHAVSTNGHGQPKSSILKILFPQKSCPSKIWHYAVICNCKAGEEPGDQTTRMKCSSTRWWETLQCCAAFVPWFSRNGSVPLRVQSTISWGWQKGASARKRKFFLVLAGQTRVWAWWNEYVNIVPTLYPPNSIRLSLHSCTTTSMLQFFPPWIHCEVANPRIVHTSSNILGNHRLCPWLLGNRVRGLSI